MAILERTGIRDISDKGLLQTTESATEQLDRLGFTVSAACVQELQRRYEDLSRLMESLEKLEK